MSNIEREVKIQRRGAKGQSRRRMVKSVAAERPGGESTAVSPCRAGGICHRSPHGEGRGLWPALIGGGFRRGALSGHIMEAGRIGIKRKIKITIRRRRSETPYVVSYGMQGAVRFELSGSEGMGRVGDGTR